MSDKKAFDAAQYVDDNGQLKDEMTPDELENAAGGAGGGRTSVNPTAELNGAVRTPATSVGPQ